LNFEDAAECKKVSKSSEIGVLCGLIYRATESLLSNSVQQKYTKEGEGMRKVRVAGWF
jgi:hypothetical protein